MNIGQTSGCKEGLLTFYIVFCSGWGVGTFNGVLGAETAGLDATDGELITVELDSSDCVLDASTLDSVVVVEEDSDCKEVVIIRFSFLVNSLIV